MAVNDSRSDAVVHGGRQNHGRGRRSGHDSSSNLSLSDLEDDLLREILQRLPTAKDAFLCSSVCKHWYGIIFSPYFIKRFITYHANHVARKNGSSDGLCGFEKSMSLVMMSPVTDHKAIIVPQYPIGQFQSFNLKSFCEGSDWTVILSSCHDLLFCASPMRWWWEYCIFNPLTMQGTYIDVPEWEGHCEGYPFAFVCEPYCSRDSQGGCVLSARLRYRVLRIRDDKLSDAKCLPIEIYCSEGGELTKNGFIEDSLFGEEFQKAIFSNVVVYNGKAHWFNGESIVAYDPFRVAVDVLEEDSSRQNGFIIKCPEYVRNRHYTSYELGVCRGRLRLMHADFVNELSTSSLTVLDLEDYEKGKWSVDRKFCLDSVVYDGHPLFEKLVQWLMDGCSFDVAVDPCNENVVYLGFDGNVALWNLERKELHIVAEFPVDELLPVKNFCGRKTLCRPIVLPWWPTPISALKQGCGADFSECPDDQDSDDEDDEDDEDDDGK